MAMSIFPVPFTDGVAIRGLPVLNSHSGKVFYVNNSTVLAQSAIGGSDNNDGTYLRPFATIAKALTACTASRGDIIICMPKHAETIATAGALDINVADVNIIGLGAGTDKATLSFSATASTVLVSANNVSIQGLILKATIDQVVTGLVVSGADAYIDVESKDTSSVIEFVTVVTTTAAADRMVLKIKHRGFTAGSHMTALVSLVGADNCSITVDFYGIASTAVINMITTASLGVQVKGVIHNGATALTKNVVDTQGSSKYIVDIYDEVGGYKYISGSGSSASVGAPVNSQTSILGLPATGNTTLFTITGGPIVLEQIIGEVTTVIQTQACNTKLQSVDAATSTATDLCAVLDVTAKAVGSFFNISGTLASAMLNTAGGTAIAQATKIVIPAGVIRVNTAATNTGAVRWYMKYVPLGSNVVVTPS